MAQGQASRDALLDAAAALMTERNSATLSLRDISDRSGINSALIKYYFGNKQGLLEALLERDAGGTFEDLETLVLAPISASEKLRHHIHGLIKFYFRYPYINRLVSALSLETDSTTARFISEKVVKPVAHSQRLILEQGMAEGVFRRIDPVFFYFSTIGACDHLFQARYALRYAFDIHDVSDTLRRDYADHVCQILFESVVLDTALAGRQAAGVTLNAATG